MGPNSLNTTTGYLEIFTHVTGNLAIPWIYKQVVNAKYTVGEWNRGNFMGLF